MVLKIAILVSKIAILVLKIAIALTRRTLHHGTPARGAHATLQYCAILCL